VLFPINISNMHWALAVAFMQKKKIVYYDSLGLSGLKYLTALQHYIFDEAANKQRHCVLEEWQLHDERVPFQNNGSDCGVFACMFADLVIDDIDVNNLHQSMMAVFRCKICYSILLRKIPYPL
jgi:sentrin-specific protease 1